MTITNDNFGTEVLESKIPVLLDFWASWCGPCKMIAPAVAQLEEEYAGKVKVGKVNIDEQGELAAQFGVMSIPTLMLFQAGEIVEKAVGARGKADIEGMIKNHISA
jgi:thioredoxin 1